MKEYVVFSLNIVQKNKDIQEILNNYAAKGWQLVYYSRPTMILEKDTFYMEIQREGLKFTKKTPDDKDWDIKTDNQEMALG